VRKSATRGQLLKLREREHGSFEPTESTEPYSITTGSGHSGVPDRINIVQLLNDMSSAYDFEAAHQQTGDV